MELVAVRLELPRNAPVMLLRESQGERRVLPIYIGSPEATSIHYAVEGVVPPRPLSHDLFCTVIAELGGELTRVVVTEVRDDTFYAELHLTANGVEHTVSSRPSDAVALAVRAHVPIFAEERVLDVAGSTEVLPTDTPAEGEDDILAEFQDFIESVSPEDFQD